MAFTILNNANRVVDLIIEAQDGNDYDVFSNSLYTIAINTFCEQIQSHILAENAI